MKTRTARSDCKRWRLVARSLVVVVLLALTPRGASGQDPTPVTASPAAATITAAIEAFYQPPVPLPSGEPGTLLRREPLSAPEGIRAWRILYLSTGLDGKPVALSGAVFAPDAPAPTVGFPLIAMGHNTTGTARQCAPSLDPFQPQFGGEDAFFAQQVAGFVTGGFAVVATDYQGLGAPGDHPFLVGEIAAHNVLDAARAARALPDLALAPSTLLWGHSQGGHAAAWAGQLAPVYAPDLVVAGVILAAPAAEPGLVLAAATSGPPEPTPLTGYIVTLVASWSSVYPELAAAPALTDAALTRIDLLETECIPTVAADFADRPLADYVDVAVLQASPWSERIEQNAAGRQPIAAPVLVLQGAADPLVPVAVTDAFVARLRAAGTSVDYIVYPGVAHGAVIAAAMPDILAWSADRMAGDPSTSTCATDSA
ncbi:MAG: alpha/beta fold hydrolase [Thermomicrobiales bacterium]